MTRIQPDTPSCGRTLGSCRPQPHHLPSVRTLAKIDKTPEIAAVRDFFEENDTAYIMMEFVDGTTFKEPVKQSGGLIPADNMSLG